MFTAKSLTKSLVPALALGAMFSMTGAKADVLLSFNRTQTGPSAGLTTFVYDINVPIGSTFRTGDFVTFYDVNGLTTGSINDSNSRIKNAQVTITEQFTGITPPTQAPPDDARFLNITFTYNGPNIPGPTDQAGAPLGELFINSTAPANSTAQTFYSAQSLGTTGNAYNTTSVIGPGSVPEPGAVAMLVGMGVTGAGFLVRRKRSK